jgi:hypothetical protein
MSSENALSILKTFLARLRPTGQDGFEGLAVRLCEAATGQRFRISGAGQQYGQDARSEPGYGNLVKVEAKHYDKSALNLRQLDAELLQAVTADPDLELWILAALCAVKDQDAWALEAHAKDLGLEIVILDLGNDGLARLGVLMAAFESAVHSWIKDFCPNLVTPDLALALAEIGAHPQFPAARQQLLNKMHGTLLGYDDARSRTNKKLLAAVSDAGNAIALFNQKVAIRAEAVHLISRAAISNELTKWWINSDKRLPRIAVLGEEGMGKTWAALAWLTERAEEERFPIILPCSAAADPISDVGGITRLVPHLLAKRFDKWLHAFGPNQIAAVVLIDGLNERPGVNWPTFFSAADQYDWRGRVAVVVTDRPKHWHPKCATSGLDTFTDRFLGTYTDSELADALKSTQITVTDIPEELQKLIRTPRYCDLVASHFDEMKREGDFTVERLIFLDAKNRAARKRGALTQSDFIEIIRNLAIQYRRTDSLTLSCLQALLPRPDPDGRIYQEIIDGGLLIERTVISTRYEVEPTRLVFGLGMLLAEEVSDHAKRNTSLTSIEDEITSWFEPHPEMDLKVRICGAALFHAFADPEYPTAGRRELLRYWLRLRNWQDGVQQAFVDYLVRCPEDFVEATEDVWSSDRDMGAAEEFLASAFIKHRDDSRLYPILFNAILRWMGFVHPAGYQFMRRKTEDEAKTRSEIEQRVGAALKNGPLTLCNQQLTVMDNDGLLRLKCLDS